MKPRPIAPFRNPALATLMLVAGTAAGAQAPEATGGYAIAPLQWSASRDSDGLVIQKPGVSVYRNWRSSSQWEAVEWQAQRYAQNGQALRGRSLAWVGQAIDPATGLGHAYRVGWSDGPARSTVVADGAWNAALGPRTQWGLFGTHDAVESIAGLRDGVSYTLLGANLDHSPIDRLTLVAAGHATRFSDDQDRYQLRLRAIWDAWPAQGLTLQLHLRHQTGEGEAPVRRYFNPGQVDEVQAVLGWRRRWEGWQFTARAGAGAQWVDASAAEPVRIAELQLQSPVRARQAFKLRWGYSQAQGLSGPGYVYRSADLSWAFQF
jgi:hypothetical protein